MYTESYHIYLKAKELSEELGPLLEDGQVLNREPQLQRYTLNLAELYNQFSVLFFCTGGYKKALDWTLEALKVIGDDSPVKVSLKMNSQLFCCFRDRS